MKYSRAKHVVNSHILAVVRRDACKVEHDAASKLVAQESTLKVAQAKALVLDVEQLESVIKDLEVKKAVLLAKHKDLQAEIKEEARERASAEVRCKILAANLDTAQRLVNSWEPELDEAKAIIAEIELREAERKDREQILLAQLKSARAQRLVELDDHKRAQLMRRMSDDRLQRMARQRSKDESSVKEKAS